MVRSAGDTPGDRGVPAVPANGQGRLKQSYVDLRLGRLTFARFDPQPSITLQLEPFERQPREGGVVGLAPRMIAKRVRLASQRTELVSVASSRVHTPCSDRH